MRAGPHRPVRLGSRHSAFLLGHLRRELDAFRACLGGDLSVPVEHCGDWTLRDLAEHLGRGNLWAATAVTEGHGHGGYAAVPEEPEAARWFQETSATLLDALDTDPSTPAWTFHPPNTVGFWQRRRCLETVVHRWDAEHTWGRSARSTRNWPATGWPRSSRCRPRAWSRGAAPLRPATPCA